LLICGGLFLTADPDQAAAQTPAHLAAAAQSSSSEPTGGSVRIEIPADIDPAERDKILRLLAIELGDRLSIGDEQVTDETGPDIGAQIDAGIERLSGAMPTIPSVLPDILRALAPGQSTASALMSILGVVALCGVAALAAGFLAWRLLRGPIVRQREARPQRFSLAMGLALVRILIGAVVIASSALGAYLAFAVIVDASVAAEESFLHLLEGTTQAAFLIWLAHCILSPNNLALRMVPAMDDEAKSIFFWAASFPIVATLIVMPVFMGGATGIDPARIGILILIAAIFNAILKIVIFSQLRVLVRDVMRRSWSLEDTSTGVLAFIANTWHLWFIFASLVILGLTFYAELSGELGRVVEAAITTQLLIIALPLVGGWTARVLREGLAPPVDSQLEPSQYNYKLGLAALLGRAARILIWIGGILLLATVWGLDFATLSEGSLGQKIIAGAIEVAIVIGVAWLGLQTAKLFINRHIDAEGGETVAGPGDEGGGAGASRLITLLPLLRTALTLVVFVVAGLVVLSSMGLDIAPLLAGAGVVGLAIGFGAQTLVRDIISGIFFLVDDAFRKGEYIDVGSVKGTVEKISIRSFQLRHHNGPLHTIPFGEIQTLTNYSRDWAIIKFEIRLPFETDIEKVRKIVKQVGKEMIADENLKTRMLEPLKSQGVNRIDDSALVIRCKFMAVPGQQFLVRREAFTRLQQALADQGIHFAPKRVLVETASAPTTNEQKVLLAAAGAGALDVEEGDAPPADDRG